MTALTYKTEIFDASRFTDARNVGAYLGMTPTQYASGKTMIQGTEFVYGEQKIARAA
ncbi:MAG: transposase [Chlamydiales bacterium]